MTVAALVFLENFDQLSTSVVGKLFGRETGHGFVQNRDQIASNRPVAVVKFNSLSGRFNGCAAGMELQRVVSEQAHSADVAAAGHAGRDIICAADNS